MNQVAAQLPQSRHLFSKLRHFTDHKSLPDGKSLHAHLLKTGLFPACALLSSTLLNFYAKCHLFSEARLLFAEMPHKEDAVSWNILINSYSQLGLAHYSFSLSSSSKKCFQHRSPHSHTFAGIFSAAAILEDEVMARQAHCVVVKIGRGGKAFGVFRRMMSGGRKSNEFGVQFLSAFTSLEFVDKGTSSQFSIKKGHAQSGDGEKALVLFKEMHFRGMKPSKYTIVGVLNACSDTEEIIMGKQVHAYLVKLGFEFQMYIMTALIDIRGPKGFDHLQEADLVLWTSMIGGYVQNGDNESAISLYCRMQMEGIAPNELTMASVLKACSSISALEQGKQIHAHVVKNGYLKFQ
ncbi:UNVERIFIED_CONTAM: Pentatricopeptide repeat-containing protein [Sesamum latifolium]|uniref:Pentatricopeptide repeat-containing protein n=1 Tax=Sesamum latifolium TaxID=2727402 RepID=A0AAW2SH10_9LAMI